DRAPAAGRFLCGHCRSGCGRGTERATAATASRSYPAKADVGKDEGYGRAPPLDVGATGRLGSRSALCHRWETQSRPDCRGQSRVTPLPICFVLPDLAGGGAQRVILELAGGLDPARFAVTLVVIGGSETLADQVSPAIQVVWLGAGRVRHGIPQLL